MRPYQITTTAYPAADTDSISLSQAAAGAGNLTITGALASGGVATISPPAFVTVKSGGNDTGITFTITGTGPLGWTQSEVVTGTNGSTATSTLAFATVTQVAVSGAVATVVEVGTAQSGYGPWLPLDIFVPNQVTTISSDITGTINYTWQFTNDNIWGDGYGAAPNPANIKAFDHPSAALVAASSDQYGSTTVLMRAVRFKVNSGSGTSRNVVTQQSTQ